MLLILQVVKEFRCGNYNTLVSTCVGEEGLDIGDVDLIVCYDAHKSPTRLVQRMGRTGRKRKGRIVMLMTEGKEASVRKCLKLHIEPKIKMRKENETFYQFVSDIIKWKMTC